MPEPHVEPPPDSPNVSTLVHGTWGWKGDWWRPSGGFHRYILKDYRTNLYAGGARFSWSGAYSPRHRARAGQDFCDWAGEVAPRGLQTVLAHSYGAEVVGRAIIAGTRVSELALLSAPGTAFVNAAATMVGRTVDVRLPFDPVLSLARVPQRLDLSIPHRLVLTSWRLDHSATHDEQVWMNEAIGIRAGL
ncbi:alpha/beta hydrolase [Serinicoccus sediminis]|uniref:alpha/beta hydrolase n=1 Tax=Serinicoccus sediminis TaxID=2306021 RepID=UPI003B5114F8